MRSHRLLAFMSGILLGFIATAQSAFAQELGELGSESVASDPNVFLWIAAGIVALGAIAGAVISYFRKKEKERVQSLMEQIDDN